MDTDERGYFQWLENLASFSQALENLWLKFSKVRTFRVHSRVSRLKLSDVWEIGSESRLYICTLRFCSARPAANTGLEKMTG